MSNRRHCCPVGPRGEEGEPGKTWWDLAPEICRQRMILEGTLYNPFEADDMIRYCKEISKVLKEEATVRKEGLKDFFKSSETKDKESFAKEKEKTENVGYVYVLSNKSLPPNTYKIGSTYKLPEERAEQLSGTGHLTPFKVVDEIKIQSAEYYEKSIHKLLNKYRVGKEYFEIELNKIKDCLQQVSILSEKGQKKVALADLKKKIKIK